MRQMGVAEPKVWDHKRKRRPNKDRIQTRVPKGMPVDGFVLQGGV